MLLALCLAGCHNSGPRPDALFESIYADYLHGNLPLARERAAKARKDLSNAGDPAWVLKFRLLEAEVLLRQSQPTNALAVLGEAEPAIPDGGDAAIKRDVLSGLAHFRLDRAEQSARELQSAYEHAQSTHSNLLAEVLRAQALVARDSNQDQLALEKYRASLAAAGDGAELVKAADLVDIGFFSLQQHHFAAAVSESRRAADYARSVGAGRQLQLALGNTGWAYQNLGDFESALTYFLDAERQAAALGLTRDQVLWLQDAGLAEYYLGHLEQARQYDERALRADMSLPLEKEVDQIANINTNLAVLSYEQGQLEAARRYSEAGAAVAAKSKDNTVIAYSRYVHGLLTTTDAGNSELMSAWQLAPDVDLRAEIESAIAKRHSEKQQTTEAKLWFERSIQTFEEKRATVQEEALRLSAFAYGKTIYRNYADFLVATHHSTQALQLLDRSRSRTLEEGLELNSQAAIRPEEPVLAGERIASSLNATILFYSLGPTQSRLWAVTAKQTQLFALPAEKEIQALVRKHQTDIQQALDPATTALYDTLVRPAASMLPTGTRVFVVADGVLHGLNFETLVTQTTGGTKYWLEDVAVTSASSIRMLSHWAAGAAPKAATDLLLIGDPAIPKGEFAPLPDAAKEMQQVRRHFQPGNQVVLAEGEAVPAAYAASNPGNFRYIHFATHGTASRLSPLESAVVLSPPPQDPDDFKLYARDIIQQPLHATLVTISACYGSGVRTYAGEGLVGLAWVFLRAGAHNVIAALWQVADSASPQLMNQLYSELQAGKAPDEALRAAKLSLLHSSRVYRKPIFWGAFQLYAGS